VDVNMLIVNYYLYVNLDLFYQFYDSHLHNHQIVLSRSKVVSDLYFSCVRVTRLLTITVPLINYLWYQRASVWSLSPQHVILGNLQWAMCLPRGKIHSEAQMRVCPPAACFFLFPPNRFLRKNHFLLTKLS